MNILVIGLGAIGSNLIRFLIPDLRGEHLVALLDHDLVEERNVQAGTQFYYDFQIGEAKAEALQFNIYKQFRKTITNHYTEKLDEDSELYKHLKGNTDKHIAFDLVVDCTDNFATRRLTSTLPQEIIHIGFSNSFTFSIEWNKGYKPPTDYIEPFDICTMPGAASFVNHVASLGALVIQEYIETKTRREIIGGKFSLTNMI